MSGDSVSVVEVELEDLSELSVGSVTGTYAQRAAAAAVRAELELRQARERAEAEGREAGFAAGMEAAQQEVEALRAALGAAAGEVLASRDAVAELAELRAAELAVQLAGKIVGASLEVAPELVLSLVTGALRRVLARDSLVLEVNPDDFAVVREHVTEMTEHLGGFHRVEVVAERRVGRGGCVVRTVEGEIDATIESQLERAQEILVDAIRRGPAAGALDEGGDTG